MSKYLKKLAKLQGEEWIGSVNSANKWYVTIKDQKLQHSFFTRQLHLLTNKLTDLDAILDHIDSQTESSRTI